MYDVPHFKSCGFPVCQSDILSQLLVNAIAAAFGIYTSPYLHDCARLLEDAISRREAPDQECHRSVCRAVSERHRIVALACLCNISSRYRRQSVICRAVSECHRIAARACLCNILRRHRRQSVIATSPARIYHLCNISRRHQHQSVIAASAARIYLCNILQ